MKPIDSYYLAYGINTNPAQMQLHCPHAQLIGTEQLYGYRLVFRGPDENHSYLSLEPDAQSSIPVAVWKLDEEDRKALDQFENGRYHYDVVQMVENGRNCFTYRMETPYCYHRPAADYLEKVREGYARLNLDQMALQSALINH